MEKVVLSFPSPGKPFKAGRNLQMSRGLVCAIKLGSSGDFALPEVVVRGAAPPCTWFRSGGVDRVEAIPPITRESLIETNRIVLRGTLVVG